MLRDSGNGGGSDSLALFGSTEHEGLVNSVKSIHHYEWLQNCDQRSEVCLLSETLSFSFSLLKPHGELTLGHLKVLDMGGSTIEKRNLAGLLVGDGKRVLEAAVTLSEFVTPTLLGLDSLTADLLPAPRRTGLVGRGGDGLEIIVIVGIG